MLELYKNIKKFRIEKKMSQQKLAELTGYTDRSSIARIENGKIDIPQSKIFLFAKALGVDPGTLYGESGCFNEDILLTIEDKDLIMLFKKLDEQDRCFIKGQIVGLLQNDKYKKDLSEAPAV